MSARLLLIALSILTTESATPEPTTARPTTASPTLATVSVDTDVGVIQGYTEDDLNYFWGIPYAQPPIDELRWASPVATDSIGNETHPYECKSSAYFVSECIPARDNGRTYSEDCLFLNIVTPSDAEYQVTSYTVMVFIHGGTFEEGSSTQSFPTTTTDFFFNPTNLVSFIGDVIFVSFNYRLAILGFLYDNMYNTGMIYICDICALSICCSVSITCDFANRY